MTPYGEIAVAFASALAEGNFARAHGLLAPELRTQLSSAVLCEELHAMYDGYAGGEPTGIRYDEQFFMSDWPAKEPHDVGWAYVSIVGEAFVEAVTVIVAEVDGTLLIRAVEWAVPEWTPLHRTEFRPHAALAAIDHLALEQPQPIADALDKVDDAPAKRLALRLRARSDARVSTR